MKDLILQTVKHFLERHHTDKAPILLGCSGGPDSMALLHLLNECRQFFAIDLHVVHIDHQWREESALEAAELAEHVGKLNLPFYLHQLTPTSKMSEDDARNERFNFFSQLYRQLQCQALILGHQADDQAETVLKRVLEGAGLDAMRGILSINEREGIKIWRPLLSHPKNEIRSWLQNKGITSFEDPTNCDPQFLRSRFRVQIVPDLEKAFGKKVSSNLIRLGKLAQEMKEYLYRKSPLFNMPRQREPYGVHLDFTPFYPLDPFELTMFLKHFLIEEKVAISYQSLATLQKLIENKAVKKIIEPLIVDKGHLFLIKK